MCVQNPLREVRTICEELLQTTGHFRSVGISTPRLDAELLLAQVLNLGRVELYLQSDRPLAQNESATFKELTLRRVKGVPVAYLTGEKEFWSLSFKVDESVLIPRPETELLVELASERIRIYQEKHPRRKIRIYEFGTGSGAVSVALCAELEQLDILASDCSASSLKIAASNLERHRDFLYQLGNRVMLVVADGVSMLNQAQRVDFLVANPPYIPSSSIADLSAEVRKEPEQALDGGEDGLDYYRMLFKTAPLFMQTYGEMLLEIGNEQQKPLEKLLDLHPYFQCLGFHKDLGNHPRVLHLRMHSQNRQ